MAVPTFYEYKREFHHLLSLVEVTTDTGKKQSLDEGLEHAVFTIRKTKSLGKKVFVIGNGGSAAIASHMQNDLCKAGGVRSLVFNEAPLLSALSNDLSYTEAFGFLVDLWAENGDLLIAISSSGQSENILRAADAAREKGCTVITLSGFTRNNLLRSKGSLNFYIPSGQYGFVELGHSVLAHYITDAIKDTQGSA